jgi:hypothetical protein
MKKGKTYSEHLREGKGIWWREDKGEITLGFQRPQGEAKPDYAAMLAAAAKPTDCFDVIAEIARELERTLDAEEEALLVHLIRAMERIFELL